MIYQDEAVELARQISESLGSVAQVEYKRNPSGGYFEITVYDADSERKVRLNENYGHFSAVYDFRESEKNSMTDRVEEIVLDVASQLYVASDSCSGNLEESSMAYTRLSEEHQKQYMIAQGFLSTTYKMEQEEEDRLADRMREFLIKNIETDDNRISSIAREVAKRGNLESRGFYELKMLLGKMGYAAMITQSA